VLLKGSGCRAEEPINFQLFSSSLWRILTIWPRAENNAYDDSSGRMLFKFPLPGNKNNCLVRPFFKSVLSGAVRGAKYDLWPKNAF